ncbi:calphotin isoform X1 [Chanodichthys erythropterus]|uniref:calphotin isoform X1 n=1 Tax=Chanodichthys erythropterus TaxID=933992 RepID=UPI00351F4602
MPSKRKKNKRRMRRVQAQRRALEEQYASSGKGTPGVCAVSAPVPARVAKLAKTSECRVSVPIPLAVVAPIDVPAEDPPVEPVVLEVPVTDAVKDEEVKAAEDLGQSLVEPPAEEPAVIEDESVAVPLSEAISSVDEPVSIPAESEIQFEDTTPVATETHVLAQPVETVDAEHVVEAELPAEDPVVEVPVPEETVTTAETVAAVETVTETVVTEVKPVADAAVEVDGHVVGVVGEPAIEGEAITVETEPVEVNRVAEVTEVICAEPEPEEFPVEAAVPTDALVEPEPEQQQQQQTVPLEEPTPSVESTSDPIAEEFVVNESVVAVETTVKEEQIPETTTDAPEVPSEALAETIPAPEPLPVPVAKEIIQAQDEFMAQVETETIKDLAVTGGLTVDAINGCLGATEVAIEG